MPPAPTPDASPTSFDLFLQQALASKEFEVFPLAGDASNRKYFRIVHQDQTYVLMQWDKFVDDANYPFLSVLNHFAKHKIQVPKVMAKAPDHGLILLEDLGDMTLERKFWEHQNQEAVIPYYKLAIDELLKIHFCATQDRQPCTAFNIQFNVETLGWEMNFALKHLIEDFCGINLSEQDRQKFSEIFTSICTRLHKLPKYICHRDYHSRNLMLKHGKMRVIDFQDARLGPVQYDLVSLLKDSYVNLSDTTLNNLLDYYITTGKNQYNANLEDKPEFMQNFELQIIQRSFKACGSFASFYNSRKDTRYLKYLSPTLHRVGVSLKKFPEYQWFYDFLDQHDMFKRSFEKENL